MVGGDSFSRGFAVRPREGKQADLHETIKSIKNRFMDHNKGGQNLGCQDENSSEAILQLDTSKIPSEPEWSIISSDAACNSYRSCLARIVDHSNKPPALSWFQISHEDTPLQVEAKAALLALNIVAERGLKKIWLRCDALLLVEAILNSSSSM
ncbi:hypothetical protein CRG98_029677 [Punica granatum]|uniref:RNase H type-1 domain-containing protein n=1 Tax=Punica granatum TaxID=22663 RepID=A0A2I0J121_PUNGR|nr:hypothetical protein CRG98_029677 [Punica granatum]